MDYRWKKGSYEKLMQKKCYETNQGEETTSKISFLVVLEQGNTTRNWIYVEIERLLPMAWHKTSGYLCSAYFYN